MAIIQSRRDTAANWTSTNPTLADGEIGYEKATGRFKVGDGSTAWNSLPYQDAGIPIPTAVQTALNAKQAAVLFLPAGSTAANIPAGTPVGTLIWVASS